jgi:hypothetical protein
MHGLQAGTHLTNTIMLDAACRISDIAGGLGIAVVPEPLRARCWSRASSLIYADRGGMGRDEMPERAMI